MRILVLGGTVFLGRTIVETAISRGHRVTIFHRGKSNPGLFADAEEFLGDRDGGLGALQGEWDAVIDTSGYVPRVVRQSAEAFRGRAGHYTFVSTISVYDLGARASARSLREDSPLATIEDQTTEEITGETYGGLKVLCEDVVRSAWGDSCFIPRPGLIVGPWDKTDRFTYWPVRMKQGGDVLVPDRLDQPVQIIDVRDLSTWIVEMAERGGSGTYNATGPDLAYRLGEVLETCRRVANPDAILVPVDTEFLSEQGVEPWSDLPLVLDYDGSADAMSRADVEHAVGQGLNCRELSETVRDTLSWFEKERPGEPLKAGLSAEKEEQVLAAWRARTT
jgi:2'-hydroxyisoflavone reductase